jgi:hypothetical protein
MGLEWYAVHDIWLHFLPALLKTINLTAADKTTVNCLHHNILIKMNKIVNDFWFNLNDLITNGSCHDEQLLRMSMSYVVQGNEWIVLLSWSSKPTQISAKKN